MASSLLKTFEKIDNGRKNIIGSLNMLGIDLDNKSSFNAIDNAIRTIDVTSNTDVRDPSLTTYYDDPLNDDPDLPKPSSLFLEYVEKFKKLETIEYNGSIYYPGIITFIDTNVDEVIFSVDSSANGSAKTNGIRIGQYGNHIVQTSDGSEYIFTESIQQFTHNWDETKDLYDECLGIKVRYLITYSKSTLSNLKTNGINVLYTIMSLARCRSSNSSYYNSLLYTYVVAKHPDDAFSGTYYFPGLRGVKHWLYVEPLPDNVSLGGYSPSDTNPHINARVSIIKLNNISVIANLKYNYSVAYIDSAVIKPANINCGASERRYGKLKYLIIRDKEQQNSLYKGELTNYYPPLLKDPYFSTLITKISKTGLFMTGVNVKNLSLPNLTECVSGAFQSGIFHTLDLSNLDTPLTFTNASIINLDLSGLTEITTGISDIKGIRYINLSGAKKISASIGSSGGTIKVREIDVSSADVINSEFARYATELHTIHLKQDFDYSVVIPYNMNFTLDCIRDIFDKAKTFLPDDEKYKTCTLNISHIYQELLLPSEIQAFLDKGWNITWNSSY